MNHENESRMSDEPLPDPRVEDLINQMALAEPSQELDDAVATIFRHSHVSKRDAKSNRFGWSSLVATALAAALVGVLAGRFISIPGDQVPKSTNVLNSKHSSSLARKSQRPRLIDEGFTIVDGSKLSRVYRYENREDNASRGTIRSSLPIRKRIIVPSQEL